MRHLPTWLQSLTNHNFAKLYLAQAINLTGDALTWLGLALLAFELAGDRSGIVLATALTLRVTIFVLLSPISGMIADRVDRKRLMVMTHLCRLVLVSLLPLIHQLWQLYAIVLGLNAVAAFFTPTYTATIPLVTTAAERPKAIALSSATYQLLGVIGPGIAGGIAAFVGTRQVFWLDGLTFLAAAILIATVPGQLIVPQQQSASRTIAQILLGVRVGSDCLWRDAPMRYALLLQLIAAIVGAQILVNTVSYVQTTLHLSKLEYGWVMAAFGIGATIAAVGLGQFNHKPSSVKTMTLGAALMAIAVLPANSANLSGLMMLWILAGMGQTLVNVPAQILIADRVSVELQGRVYGAQFAWSHFWWMFAYPLAGAVGYWLPEQNFVFSGLLSVSLLTIIYLLRHLLFSIQSNSGKWHIHPHQHDSTHHHIDYPQDDQHEHAHEFKANSEQMNCHLHFHPLR